MAVIWQNGNYISTSSSSSGAGIKGIILEDYVTTVDFQQKLKNKSDINHKHSEFQTYNQNFQELSNTLETKEDKTKIKIQTDTTLQIQPGDYNKWQTPISNLLSITNTNFEGSDEYILSFIVGTNFNLIFKAPIRWLNEKPLFKKGEKYLISIIDNIAVGGVILQ